MPSGRLATLYTLQQLRSGVGDFRLIADISGLHRFRMGAERARMAPGAFAGLPFANVCPAVHVQHLPCYLTGFRQINDV